LALSLGIDIGGSKTAIGLVDLARGTIVLRCFLETPMRAMTGLPFLRTIVAMARQLCIDTARNPATVPVGIGICEFVDASSRIVSAYRVVLHSSDILVAFSQFNSVVVEADVRAAAVAEARLGLGKGLGSWIYVNAGTGIASVLMSEDRCYLGSRGWALGLGMCPPYLSPAAAVAKPQYLEEFCGGEGLVTMAAARHLPVANVRELIALVRSGSNEAADIVTGGGQVLGRAIAMLVNVLDPEAVIVGGGLASAELPYLEAVKSAAAAHIWHGPAKATPILRAKYADEGGLLGAAVITCHR
jgi:glucokinase